MRLGFVGVAMLAIPSLAVASTYVVNPEGTGDLPTIQAAIRACAPGDTVLCASGVYTGPGNKELDFGGVDLILRSAAGSSGTTLDLQAQGSHAIRFHSGETRAARVEGFRILDGVGTLCSGVWVEQADPTLVDLVFERSAGFPANSGAGRAIHCVDASPLLQELVVRGQHEAGAMYCEGGAPVLFDALFEDNGAEFGAGLYCVESAAQLERVTFRANKGADGLALGCGMACIHEPSATLVDVRFEENYSGEGMIAVGAGLYCHDSSPTLTEVLFTGNHSDMSGGALYCQGGAPQLERVTFWANDSPTSASVVCTDAAAPLLDRVIISFDSSGYGLSTSGGSAPVLTCCDVYGNAAGSFGGDAPNWTGVNGNISADPLFCLDLNPDDPLTLANGSPCSAANSPCGQDIGARSVGCEVEYVVLSGSVLDEGGQPVSGVDLRVGDLVLEPGVDGNFALWLPAGWSGRVMPFKAGWVFAPAWRDYVELDQDAAGQDFAGKQTSQHRVPEDHPDLQDAFAASLDGDSVLVGPGIYVGPRNRGLSISSRALVVIGTAGPDSTVIDCEGQDQALKIHFADAGTEVRGLTIRNGWTAFRGGGIDVYNAAPRLADLRLESCEAQKGGGIYLWDADGTQLERLVAIGNHGLEVGGAIYVQGAVIATQLTLLDNRAGLFGGGIYVWEGSLELERSILFHNSARYGGGLYLKPELADSAIACCDIFANSGGEVRGSRRAAPAGQGNIAANPLFCDEAAGDLRLELRSPCAAANSPCGLAMGAEPAECTAVLHLISGRVTDAGGQPLSARIEGDAHGVWTDGAGEYALLVPDGWSGELRCYAAGQTFTPPLRAYAMLATDVAGQDYSGHRSTLRRVPADFAAIQPALDFSLAGDTVLVAPGIYPPGENSGLSFGGRDLVLLGQAGSQATVIDCEGAERGFTFRDGETAAALVQGFSVINGFANVYVHDPRGGGILAIDASPTFRDIVVADCRARDYGGGIMLGRSTSLMENLTCVRNSWADSQYLHGGGLHLYDADPTIRDALIAENYASDGGGGLYCTLSSPQLERVTIVRNGSGWNAGGLYLGNGSSPTLDACIVAENYGYLPEHTGGIYGADDASQPVLTCCDVFGNIHGDYGGSVGDQTGQQGNIALDPLFCSSADGDYHLRSLSPCLPGNNACGVQMGVFGEGCVTTVVEDGVPPPLFSLGQNFPNPFNPSTAIRFTLPEAARVTLAIFDIAGRLVATLVKDELRPAGEQRLDWSGRSDTGRPLPAGIYLCRLEGGGRVVTRKMVLVK